MSHSTRLLLGAYLAAIVASILAGPDARAADRTACAGLFPTDLVLPGSVGIEVLDVSRRRATLSSCGEARARTKARRRATHVRVVFRDCVGIAGRAIVTATIPSPSCTTIAGRLKASRMDMVIDFTGPPPVPPSPAPPNLPPPSQPPPIPPPPPF